MAKSVILVLGCIFLSCKAKNAKPILPNIIIIYADDMGFGDATCYNPDSKIPTSHIDRLAAEGIKFTDAHAAAAVCTPSRYALLTGQYPFRSALKKGVLWTYSRPLIPKDLPTMATMLKETGYHTAIIGKWHLGFNWPTGIQFSDEKWITMNEEEKEVYINFSDAIAGGPNQAGFHYFFGMDTPNFPPYAFLENGRIVGETPTRNDTFTIAAGVPGVQQTGWNNGDILPTLKKKAIQYISERQKHNGPFFLFLSLTAPHTPIVPNRSFQGKSLAGDYGDFVVEIDALTGKIMDELKTLEIDKQTLVIFTSDNGSPGHYEQGSGFGEIFQNYGHKTNGMWRGLKGDSWEGGHRIPLIMRWPEKISGGKVSDKVICQTDLIATFAQLTNAVMKKSLGLDSYSLLPLIIDSSQEKFQRPPVVHQSSKGHLSIRDGHWKLILGKGSGGITSWIDPNDGIGKLPAQLYNLKDDPKESINLYEQDEAFVKISEELSRKLDEIVKME